ncbi:C40 family peptidase [Paenibacillus vini]|uniref:NlpC/P60 domain-containing protein n=1 Tax=Paenibacillus vini TaxID=1476024 RepID=A0ABQ4MAF5_9BACL|nr:NlpC/P60 family protein [Paenibacillus vini]GIP52979.1 hypothetical protein J42TS3_20140 [Paenibacillus vini]
MNKAYKSVDTSQTIHEDKTGIHKKSVRTSLDHSVKGSLIKKPDYSDGRKSFKNYSSSLEQNLHKPFHQKATRYRTAKSEGPSSSEQSGEHKTSGKTPSRSRGEIGGASGAAMVAGVAHTLVNPDKSGIHSTFVNDTFGNTVAQKMVNTLTSEIHSRQIAGTAESRGLIQSAGRTLAKEIGSAVEGEDSGSVGGKTRRLASRYGYRAGKYSVKSVKTAAQGTYRFARYSGKLAKEVRGGNLSGKEAALLGLKRGNSAVSSGIVSSAKVIKQQTIRAVVEFEGSDDLGLQAVTRTRDAILTTKRSITTVGRTVKATKRGIQGSVKMAQKAAIKVQQAARYIGAVAKKAIASPVFVKAVGIIVVVILVAALVMSVSSAITSIIPTISLKSEDKELTKTYKYVTELDAELTKKIQDIPKENNHIDQFHYYANGYEVDPASLTIETDADLILVYFDTKYDDYAFDKLIYGIFGGTNVKSEVEELHKKLYQFSTKEWKEEITHTTTTTDEDGNTHTETWTETIRHMDVNVQMKSFQTYLTENKDTLLTKDEQERMEALQTVGIYTVMKELGNPFIDQPWGISSRFGWRVHPISGKLAEHNGIDIPMPGGTPINSVMYGEVTKVAFDAGGFGNHAVVTWGEREVLYAHMSSVAVKQGDTVAKGAVIGYVGSTGSSTGNHLHMEYKKKDYLLNPQFYLDGASAGAAMNGEGYSDLIAYAEQYLGLPYLFGGSAPPRFDCSGFICWVYTHSGTRNLPRTTAQGIYNQTVKISESEAQPGDLVFFHHTYDSPNPITHVGIYVGNGQMLHAGDPIQYTSFHTAYWQKFNPVFGRLK